MASSIFVQQLNQDSDVEHWVQREFHSYTMAKNYVDYLSSQMINAKLIEIVHAAEDFYVRYQTEDGDEKIEGFETLELANSFIEHIKASDLPAELI